MIALKGIRKLKGVTQQSLADIIGTTSATISRYENGERKIDLETAAKIAKALGCTVDDLIRGQ